LGNEVDLIIGGECPGGVESTVVDVTKAPPVVLREGAISQHEIEAVCGLRLARQAQKGKPGCASL
jgi:L-threonylcarbamoyladenylate synthase